MVVLGIGGSNLGTIAVQEAIFGRFYNQQKPDVKIYYADTVDSDYILDILLLVEQELQKEHNILLNVVSKSGTTTETIANFEIFLHMLKSYRPVDYNKYVVVTTDEHSPLWKLAESEDFSRLSVPKNVGGRFSVFSAVGLFPLGFIDVDIDQLQAGAQDMVQQCISNDLLCNPAVLLASIIFAQYKNGYTIHDMFLFSNDLRSLGMWYRQLLAESIGKKIDVGITPILSLGTRDLHSMAQLRLAGPNNTFTTFVSLAKNKSNVPVPCFDIFEKLVANIQCKPLSEIMSAIFTGVQLAYKKKKCPFISIVLSEKNAYSIGQFLQLQMISIMYLGYLFNVNPFDQPEVELYKSETRKILSHE